ncbi:hypothetical protein V3C99_011658 [Haemonchus contortus]
MLWTGLICLFTLCQAQEIKRLPGVGFELNFQHYSGFFQVSHTHVLHYWFVESRNDPQVDPLIFWFNGGPGCSSLAGLLIEMGPYLVNSDGKSLKENPYSWNKMASVVYIESPAGVGYSYSTDGNITANDDQTSLENYEAVKQFFQTFPQFRYHATFIMGESFGGVYVPLLAERILVGQKDFPINLKGIALGNGLVHEKLHIDTSIRYAYGHGIVDEDAWNTLQRDCCGGCIDTCDLAELTGRCASMVEDIVNFLLFGELNPYDLFGDCDVNPMINGDRMTHMLQEVVTGFMPFVLSKKETRNLMSLLKARESRYNDAAGYNSSLLSKTTTGVSVSLLRAHDYPCENNTNVLTYMNDAEVRKALNIPCSLPEWDICSDQITYNTYQNQYKDMAPFIRRIVAANVRVLLYYGDTDMVCNFMMGQKFADQLGLKRTLGKTPWKFDRQIAGFKTLFEGLTFITVRGAGHEAPRMKAPQMYYAIQQFLFNQPI